ncbi:MAG: gliding motility-associated peptidyl-prolyl isomerase GldI [Xanthomarina sp.]|uniref:Peptidyl-prolyl cis-trans isomerase n=1 Tax=Xanthomarina gelatinilytica TaxID=1137281 RepID=A0A3C0EZK3_9FLAO|nr:gliding motility-associated peptidyl-prolyl isomerase GldI [Xanthomarina sp.]HAB27935.1 gliding motility-associated peptidyl-prolyl isomerase GldI [Xanthomarina gelatinilytica]MAL22878.1 gliding motility-associated peptidyl-prolyl isomerase GldI [Xanthomarina sp.]MBF61645.1 gliding motility-associated peptidyl-prolyl isomerase GldI [Xanthomarina sp.]HAI16559.1 gliding motility-associated peptidyl-prolyl isomerase GldI [Xanthomarina gelatinilytica]HCY80777.1 gliding motility-associated pepti|tara:strand:+ start:1694 stop:2230 length:537 start_codon:yes stop_codon:yes gene_type:complete
MSRIIALLICALLFVACKSPEARRPVSSKSGSFIDASVERNIKLNEREQAYIKKIMSENPEQEYIASENGFWYYYNVKQADSLMSPDFGDIVTFNYNIKTLTDDIIYSKEDLKPQTYVMDKQELFSGLREGLKLMKSGETVTFMFPSQKAYGYYGDENKIGINVPIKCEVSVNSIIDK